MVDFYCTEPSVIDNKNPFDKCHIVHKFFNAVLMYANIIEKNIAESLNYDYDFDKKYDDDDMAFDITNKITKIKKKYIYLELGSYHVKQEKWKWIKSIDIINSIYNAIYMIDSELKIFGDKTVDIREGIFMHEIKIKYEHHQVIPFLINILSDKTKLIRLIDSAINPKIFTYVLIWDFELKIDITMHPFIDAMNNIKYANDIKKQSKLNKKMGKLMSKLNLIKHPNAQIIRNSIVIDKKIRKLLGSDKSDKRAGKIRTQKRVLKKITKFEKKSSNGNYPNNEKIIKWFKLLIKQLVFYVGVKTGKDKLIYSYKVNSIKKALMVINKIGFEIKSGSQIIKYKGIGKGTVNRIDEILKTGELLEVKEADISGKHLEYVEELMQIFGIGRVKAYELYTKHDIKSIRDLKKAIKNKKIKLPENILKGIKYVDKIKTKIPRAEVDDMYTLLIMAGIEFDPSMDVRVCGSYRREKATSNDIDIVISHPDIITKSDAEKSNLMKRFIKKLIKSKFIIDSLTSLDVATKYMGVCKLNSNHPLRRIDVRYIAQESYYTAILYFTGSRSFNRKMRSIALSMGYTLNEYRLLNNNGKPFKVKSEKDVFEYLNMEYVVPKDRV